MQMFKRFAIFALCSIGLLSFVLHFGVVRWEVATRHPYGVINLTGDWLLPPIFQKLVCKSSAKQYWCATPLEFDVSSILHDCSRQPMCWWLVFDQSGKLVSPFQLCSREMNFCGESSPRELAQRVGPDPYRIFDYGFTVKLDESKQRWGCVDKNGRQIIPYEYELVTPPRNGFAVAERADGFDMYDLKGKIIEHYDAKGYEIFPLLKQLYVENAVTPDWYSCLKSSGEKLRLFDCTQVTQTLTEVSTHGPDIDEDLSGGCITYPKHRCGIVDKAGQFVLPMRYRKLVLSDDQHFIAALYD